MKTFYKPCTHCGARLDPGETCDCQTREVIQAAAPVVTWQSQSARGRYAELQEQMRAASAEHE